MIQMCRLAGWVESDKEGYWSVGWMLGWGRERVRGQKNFTRKIILLMLTPVFIGVNFTPGIISPEQQKTLEFCLQIFHCLFVIITNKWSICYIPYNNPTIMRPALGWQNLPISSHWYLRHSFRKKYVFNIQFKIEIYLKENKNIYDCQSCILL